MTITMYGADWCGDCLRSKAYLENRGVPYDYVDLVADPDSTEMVLQRNNGLKRIPVIVFEDDTHLTEPSDEALGAKLDELEAAKAADGQPTFEVVERADIGRFELLQGGEMVSFASYTVQQGPGQQGPGQQGPGDGGSEGASVIVPHVETLPQHRGQGYADRLMAGMLDIIEADGRRIVALCPFAAAHLRDNPRPSVVAA